MSEGEEKKNNNDNPRKKKKQLKIILKIKIKVNKIYKIISKRKYKKYIFKFIKFRKRKRGKK